MSVEGRALRSPSLSNYAQLTVEVHVMEKLNYLLELGLELEEITLADLIGLED